jgi:hypothetical protein
MITKEQFISFIDNFKKFNDEVDRWNSFGIDLCELPITEYPWKAFDVCLESWFNDEGLDWIHWWLYEKGEDNSAYDEGGIKLATETPEDLWNIVIDYRK